MAEFEIGLEPALTPPTIARTPLVMINSIKKIWTFG